jgi:ATP-binding cassette subfamily F protein uup
LAILEDYLDNFQGIVITVSHDRYFLDRIVRRIFAFEGNGKVVQYEGGYTDYMAKRPSEVGDAPLFTNEEEAEDPKKADSRETWGHQKKLKFTFKEQKEYETIESDIEKLEQDIADLDAEILKNATNYGKLNALSQEKEEKEELLMEKMERWEYLEDLARKIAEQG